MERYKAHFTVEECRAATAERHRLKAEKDEAQRQEHMAKAGERQALSQLAGAVDAMKRLRWNALDPNDERSPLIVPREDIEALRRALGGR